MNMSFTRTLIASLLLVSARAEESKVGADSGIYQGSAWDMSSENDVYGNWGDRYYTNGIRFAYVSENQRSPAEATSLRWFLGGAQEIYAPADRYSVDPPTYDHPYSAFLYLTTGVVLADHNTQDLLMLNLGVVGPAALGEQVQNNVHRTFGVKPLNGWDSQLDNEPGLNALVSRTWRFRLSGNGGTGWGADILPRVGGEAGTVRVRGFAGVQVRFGQNLPADFGEARMRDGLTGATPVKYLRRKDSWWKPDAWYVFGDVQAELRAWTMPLDGNIWHDSRSVDSEVLVGRFSCGIAAHWGVARVALTQMVHTREFKTQTDKPFTSGALTVTVSH